MSCVALLLCGLLGSAVGAASGGRDSRPAASTQRLEAPPPDLLEVGVTEQLGTRIPLDLKFKDSGGRTVSLSDFFDGKRPVILTLNYSNCPMLCNLQLTGLFEGLERMQWDLGTQFQMVTLSIDPLETTARAALTKQKYLKQYGRSGAAAAYHCLVGAEQNIRALAAAVGFRYKYLADRNEYVHAATAIILTPDGRVARYLYDVQYDPQTLRLALVEASDGAIGSTVDQVLLFCYQYDATSGRYAPAALNIMRIAGVAAVVVVGAVLMRYRRRERRSADAVDSDASEREEQREAGGR